MDNEWAINVIDVKKSFKVYYDRSRTLKDLLARPGKGEQKSREVLNGISFQVKKGEAVALIGKNGCGKSTMLKLLTKIMYPDAGKIQVKGKVSSLLELGAGFHPDMSGRENIYLNASVFGLTRKEIDKKVDEIIEFSELEKFIDNPVRTYSSGMYMRLAFSVAINVKAEVLLIDEILGVGDVSFQKKCFNKLKEIKESGTTIVIVSYSMDQIERICDRSIWIYEGKIREEGKSQIVGEHYYEFMEAERLGKLNELEEKKRIEAEKNATFELNKPAFYDRHAVHNGDIYFKNIKLKNQKGEEKSIFETGENIVIEMNVEFAVEDKEANLAMKVYDENQILCYKVDYESENHELLSLKKKNKITFCLIDVPLLSGEYSVSVALYDKDKELLEEIKYVKDFLIHSKYELTEKGIIHMEHKWN